MSVLSGLASTLMRDGGDVTLPKWELDVLLQLSKTRETDLDVAEMLI